MSIDMSALAPGRVLSGDDRDRPIVLQDSELDTGEVGHPFIVSQSGEEKTSASHLPNMELICPTIASRALHRPAASPRPASRSPHDGGKWRTLPVGPDVAWVGPQDLAAKKIQTAVSFLLVFIPASLVLAYLVHGAPLWVFVTGVLAIVPLAALIQRATEELARLAGPAGGWSTA
jgi:hypothetical protein